MIEPQVIDGPSVELPGGVIYHVTLPSGAIVTSPAGFGDGKQTNGSGVIVAEDGTVLARPRPHRVEDEKHT
jgi:hypothetical protein